MSCAGGGAKLLEVSDGNAGDGDELNQRVIDRQGLMSVGKSNSLPLVG